MNSNSIMHFESGCDTCGGDGHTYNSGGCLRTCVDCGGHGVIKEHITPTNLISEHIAHAINNMGSYEKCELAGALVSDDCFVDRLLNNTDFVDKLLKKVATKMNPNE
jgi:hypothetical protein